MTNGVRSYRSDYIAHASSLGTPGSKKHRVEVPENRQLMDRKQALCVLSALAIIQIILYQLNISIFASSHASMILFMVQAGYFITSFAVVENFEKGGITYGGYLLKRFVALYPALLTVVVITFLLCSSVFREYIQVVKHDWLSCLLCFENIKMAAGTRLIILSGACESPFAHFWFVSNEIQFILVWPALVIMLIGRGTSSKTGRIVRKTTLILAFLSAVEMCLIYLITHDVSRVFYAPDTRLFAFLAGGWLAFLWPWGQYPQRPVVPRQKQPFVWRVVNQSSVRILGMISFISMILISIFIDQNSAFFYCGGMFLLSIMSVCLIADAMVVGSIFSRLTSIQALVRCGKRAYALYAWHYPICVMLGVWRANTPWYIKLLAFVLIVVISEITYYLFEYEQPKRETPQRNLSHKYNMGRNAIYRSNSRSGSYRNSSRRSDARRYRKIRH